MNRDGDNSGKYAEFSGFATSAKYVVGVDLGTSNCELAYLPVDGANDDEPRVLEIPQFVATSTIERRDKLPSALYVGPEEERGLADWRLPWNETSLDGDAEANEVGGDNDKSDKDGKNGKGGFFRKIFGIGSSGKADAARPSGTSNPNALYLVGEIALRRAAETPERAVVSAKSWLTHSRVDRREPILPWGAPDGTSRVSPVEASRRYLAHLVAAWNDAFPDAPMFEQQVVLTVPASFDESARELTREAAVGAGFNPETLIFLEEPSAAAYAWLAQKGNSWRKELAVGDVALVCDVGGGTTDLSLIRVEEEDGDLVLNRLAVGNRLLLGGDNVDLALAHRAAALFAEKGTKLNPWQAGSLWRQCRDAKETLLGGSVARIGEVGGNSANDESGENAQDGEETYKITALGRSSQLVGGSVSVDFPKAEATAIVLDGFFPICSLDDRPKRRSAAGLREAGLPFEADAAVTRHVAAFLNSRTDDDGAPIRPTRYLLNGGVFKSKAIAERFEEQLRAWFPDAPPTNLNPDADLDRAVARGAAFYGLAKRRGGIRIRGASARSYYIGIESAGLAIPGVPRPMKALCVAPVGMEEGTELAVPSDEFELVVGEPAVFRFFGSTTRPQDRPGTLLDLAEDDGELLETDPIETALEAPESDGENGEVGGTTGGVEYVATRFRTVVTELGALEIWCEEVDGPRRWKLEFSVRED